jgi:hypothetical protein
MSDIRCRHCGHRYGWRGGISYGAMCELGRLAREHEEAEHPELLAALTPPSTDTDRSKP